MDDYGDVCNNSANILITLILKCIFSVVYFVVTLTGQSTNCVLEAKDEMTCQGNHEKGFLAQSMFSASLNNH